MNYNHLLSLLTSDNVYDRLKENEQELFALIPELKVCKGFDQKSSWHIYDVYEHILHVVAGVEPDLILRLTALFHDVGKPPAFTLDSDGVGHFWGHWDHSGEIFNRYAPSLGLKDEDVALISALIFYHDMNVDRMTDEQLCEMVKRIGKQHIKKLFAIKRADLLAQNSKYHSLLENIHKQEQTLLSRF